MATYPTASDEARFSFDRLQRWLHWTMALLIFVAIGLGIASAYFPVGTTTEGDTGDSQIDRFYDCGAAHHSPRVAIVRRRAAVPSAARSPYPSG